MKKLLVILALTGALSACRKDDVEEAASREVFKFTRSPDARAEEDLWIILRDNATGELIDSQQVGLNSTEVFQSSKPLTSGLSVSIFTASTLSTSIHSADVFGDVEVGSEWNYARLDPIQEGLAAAVGEYSLTISDVPSAPVTFSVSGDDGIANTAFSYNSGTIQTTAKLRPDALTHLIYVDAGVGAGKYLALDDIADGKDVSVSYNSFLDFDKVVSISFPETTKNVASAVYGHKESRFSQYGYILNSYEQFFANDTRTQINLGFLNSIPKYEVHVDIGDFYYTSKGPAPTSIEYINPNEFTSSATSYSNFEVTTSHPYLFHVASFDASDANGNFFVNYHALSGNTKFFDPITNRIAAMYSINAETLRPHFALIGISGRSYKDYILSKIDADYDHETQYEETMVAIKTNP